MTITPEGRMRDYVATAIVSVAVLAAGFAGVVYARTQSAAAAAPAPRAAGPVVVLNAAPVLAALARLKLDADHPQVLRLVGDHFEIGLALTMRSPFYVFTFPAGSGHTATATSVEFDASMLEEGTYAVTVRNPSGRVSNEIALVVQRR